MGKFKCPPKTKRTLNCSTDSVGVTFVFFIVYLLLPFRLLLACGVKNYLLNRVKALDWWLEERFLYFLAITSGLQWLLDYLGLWRWYA